jgi:hypothetical protein
MKKTLFLCGLLCLLSVVNVFAAKPVSVKSGDISVLKKPSKALLEIDDSAAKVGDQTLAEYLESRGGDFVRDWPKDKGAASINFAALFNKKNKKGMQLPSLGDLETIDSDATYKMVIRISSLDMGNGASAFTPMGSRKAGGCIMSGTADIVDLKTNEVVCTLNIDKIKGLGTFSEAARLTLMFRELATSICKLK